MKPRLSLKTALYEILEVAPPGNRGSHYIRLCTMLLVLLNTMALILGCFGSALTMALILQFSNFFTPYQMYLAWGIEAQIYFFWIVETLSTAFFAVEYILRLWSASDMPRFRGRFRFSLRILGLIDLVAILPFVAALLAPSHDVMMVLLRFGWGLRHLKLLRYLRSRPVVAASCDSLLHDAAEQLAQVRQQVAQGRELDLARVQQSLDAIRPQCSEVLERYYAFQRHQPQRLGLPTPQSDAGLSRLPTLLDRLEADLTDAAHTEEYSALVATAYYQSAGIFDTALTQATVDVELDAVGRVGPKPVPVRRLGRKHFTPMASRYMEVSGKRQLMYVADVHGELGRIRTAITSALDSSASQEGEIILNRAISQLRDVDSPVRLEWDNILWHLEEEHHKRLQAVRTDIERYGSLAFYLGNLWRWLIGLLYAMRQVHELPVRAWAIMQRQRREKYAAIVRAVRPVLQGFGIVKAPTRELLRALDEARLDSVFARDLPDTYLVQFEFSPLTDFELFLGPDAEFSHIYAGIERWQARRQSSFILYGHPGVGKSTLLHMARRRHLAEHLVTHETITQKISAPEVLVEYLAELLDFPDVEDGEALSQALLAGPPRAIWLEDCHHLLFRNVNGLEAIRHLFWLIAKTNSHIFWGITLNKSCYDFLNQTMPLDELFHEHIHLQGRNAEELRRLMMLRHTRRGVSLHYVHDKRNDKALRRQVKRLRGQRRFGRVNLQEALELTFFESLATVSDGNITVALFYWLRALQVKDAERYEVQPCVALNVSLIWQFSQEQAFILAALLQHGKLTAIELAHVLDLEVIELQLELEILTTHNILQPESKADTFEVNPVVLKTAYAMLQARNLLQ